MSRSVKVLSVRGFEPQSLDPQSDSLPPFYQALGGRESNLVSQNLGLAATDGFAGGSSVVPLSGQEETSRS